MSTDWNKKLAWVLRDLPDPTLDLLQLSAHRTALLGDVGVDANSRADWLTCSADRVPFPQGKAGTKVQVDWAKAPEVTHPTSKARKCVEPIDIDAAGKVAGELVAEASKRFGQDPRKLLLWMCRYLPERLSSVAGGPGPMAEQIPADPRLPNLSVWQRMAFDAALAAAGSKPAFLVVQVLPAGAALEEAVSWKDMWAASRMDAELIWQAMLPIVDELGPEAILSPAMLRSPQVDRWLSDQGVTPAEAEAGADAPTIAGSLPSVFVALVPSDRARELGAACKKRFEDSWDAMVTKVRDKLAADGWTSPGDESWASTWSRQASRAFELSWTSVMWGEDSTGAGSLLSKVDVTAHEKWARVHEDAAGLDDPWPGIYFGLWYTAALGAAAARRQMGSVSVLCEPDRPCTACGHRAALDGDAEVARFWEPIAGSKGKSAGAVETGEALCSVCSLRRMAKAAELVSFPAGFEELVRGPEVALVLFQLDQAEALLRGGKELKHAATTADSVHSELDKPFVKKARAQVKEILETPAPLGPARQLAVQEAMQSFLRESLPPLLAQHGAFAVHASDREILILSPVATAYPLVRALHDRQRQAFVEVPTASGARLVRHVGPGATSSALLAIAPSSEVAGGLLHDCRSWFSEAAVGMMGGDALVMMVRAKGREDRIYAAHWTELATSVDVLLAALPSMESRKRLVLGLEDLAAALSNPDLDKPSPAARPALVSGVLSDLGPVESEEEVSRAVCQLVDHCVRLPFGTDEKQALDGLRVMATLRGADQ